MILLLDELHALGVAFVSLAEGIDATTPAGRLQLHVLGAIAEFERARIRERVIAGLARARAHGTKLGKRERRIPADQLPVREAARRLGVRRTTLQRALARKPLESTL